MIEEAASILSIDKRLRNLYESQFIDGQPSIDLLLNGVPKELHRQIVKELLNSHYGNVVESSELKSFFVIDGYSVDFHTGVIIGANFEVEIEISPGVKKFKYFNRIMDIFDTRVEANKHLSMRMYEDADTLERETQERVYHLKQLAKLVELNPDWDFHIKKEELV